MLMMLYNYPPPCGMIAKSSNAIVYDFYHYVFFQKKPTDLLPESACLDLLPSGENTLRPFDRSIPARCRRPASVVTPLGIRARPAATLLDAPSTASQAIPLLS